jgi:hypothetical protein
LIALTVIAGDIHFHRGNGFGAECRT